MKKIFFSIVALIGAFTMNAQDVEPKEALQGEVSPAVSALRLATDLVKYGYAQQSALPLIDALQIISENPTQPLETEVKGETATPETDKKNGTVTLDFNKILADAKVFADEDESLLKLISQIENDAAGAHRGAVNGPRRGSYSVSANRYNDFNVSFVEGYLAEVAVSGDGDTDLDLYIYDSNGNLIASDEDYTDDCYVNWVPAWTGRFVIRVVNRGGVYNNYVVVTN
ncbi:hypothetical protein LJC54_10425 [Parabacteroides sp. OttesenSCG-928-J18]|nr:hypothetical protein [Parabacteroides sp. OttesenSCG-928-J18]